VVTGRRSGPSLRDQAAARSPSSPRSHTTIWFQLTKVWPASASATGACEASVAAGLGIFKAMAGAGPVTVDELTRKTGLHARYVRAGLETMVAAEYIDYEPAGKTFFLPPEHAVVLADEESAMFMGGAIEFLVPAVIVTPKVQDAFPNR
jgi:hypothetical protein